MRRAAPVAIAVLTFGAFTLEGLAFASWAVERAPECRAEPSLECAVSVFVAPLLALAGGLAAGIAGGIAMSLYLDHRRRGAFTAVLVAACFLAALHVVQLA